MKFEYLEVMVAFFFFFKFVVVLLLAVQGSEAFLPMSPLWPELLGYFLQILSVIST